MHPTSLSRRSLLQLAGVFFAAGSAGAAVPAASEGRFSDGARSRALPWLLRLPDAAAFPAPWPVVLHSHGLGGSRDGGALWGSAWAQAGIAVLHLQHPGSDTETLRGGLSALRSAANAEQLLARVRDVVFVLDELARRSAAGEPPWSRLRPSAVGLSGHSFGAVTTQAVAGQRFAGARSLDEPRLRAFAAFSPSPPRDGVSLQQAFGAISRPFLCLTGSNDDDPFHHFDGGPARAKVYEGLPAGKRALLWLDGADHMCFGGGRPASLPKRELLARPAVAREREAAHQALAARITAQWWRWHLLGDETARAALEQPQGLGPGDRWSLG